MELFALVLWLIVGALYMAVVGFIFVSEPVLILAPLIGALIHLYDRQQKINRLSLVRKSRYPYTDHSEVRNLKKSRKVIALVWFFVTLISWSLAYSFWPNYVRLLKS